MALIEHSSKGNMAPITLGMKHAWRSTVQQYCTHLAFYQLYFTPA